MKRASLAVILCVVLALSTSPSHKAAAQESASAGALPRAGSNPAPAPVHTNVNNGQFTPLSQTASLFEYEARTVYLTNLERRKAGLAPLRWNRELTLASRWFAWDSIENRPGDWVGHQDSQGGWPNDRALSWGYKGGAGSENAGRASWLLSPEEAVKMWMDSPGHRENLLSPNHWEIGVGFYSLGPRNASYMVQGFGNDTVFPPLIIENEAPYVNSPSVTLYQHSPTNNGTTGIGPAVEMMLSGSPCFEGAAWQPYQAETRYTLPAGEGWKTVYSKIRDQMGRTLITSDSIYLGASLPVQTLDLAQLGSHDADVTLYGLDGAGLDRAQFSLGWVADDSSADFKKWWGNGETVTNDPAAVGSTAFRMFDGGGGETMVWITSHGFLTGAASYMAYFRLKTNTIGAAGEIARISVEANGVSTQLSLKGTDFIAADQYQEFAVPFTFDNSASDLWLKLSVWRSGSPDIYFDDVSVFTAPQSFNATHTLSVPGENYRGQGVWVRYSNANSSTFTPYTEARTAMSLSASGAPITLMAEPGTYSRYKSVSVNNQCAADWGVSQAPTWLETTTSAGELRIRGTESKTGTYTGSVVLQATGSSYSVNFPVRLVVADHISQVNLPAVIGR